MLIMEMFAVVKNYYVLREKLLKKVGEVGTICIESSQRKKLTRKRNRSCQKLPLIVAGYNGNSIGIRIVRT